MLGGITKGGGSAPGWHSVNDPWPSIERARKLGTSDRERRRRAYGCISAGCAVMAEFVTCRSPVPGHDPHGTSLPWAVLCFDPVSGCPSVSKENIRLYPQIRFGHVRFVVDDPCCAGKRLPRGPLVGTTNYRRPVVGCTATASILHGQAAMLSSILISSRP